MFNDSEPPNGSANMKKKEPEAVTPSTNAVANTVLFHPLCADRLENAISCDLERLATILQTASFGVEKSIALLARNFMLFEPNERRVLLESLHQSLNVLNSIQMFTGKIDLPFLTHIETLQDNMKRIFDAANQILSRHIVERLLAETARKLKDDTIGPAKRKFLENQEELLLNSLNELKQISLTTE